MYYLISLPKPINLKRVLYNDITPFFLIHNIMKFILFIILIGFIIFSFINGDIYLDLQEASLIE